MLGPQLAALGPDTRLVTLTAGGNDVGYVGDLTAMAYRNRGDVIGTMVGRFWKGAKPAAARDFQALGVTLKAIPREIGQRSPQAHVIVVSYPRILPDHGTCGALGITPEQARLMREVGERLARATLEAAKSGGATIVDMATLSAGNDACSAVPWVNGFKPATGADFHPTLAGAHATAEAIAQALGQTSTVT